MKNKGIFFYTEGKIRKKVRFFRILSNLGLTFCSFCNTISMYIFMLL